MANTLKFYQTNLVRDLHEREHRAERQRKIRGALIAGSLLTLVLSTAYSGLALWKMENVLKLEQKKLDHLKGEYQKYKSSRLIIEKGDVELLNSLQGRGIFWTKKLAAMAKHLPDNYWITQFSYGNGELKVSGYGYSSANQDQLLVLDGYLNRLRRDSAFAGTFKHIHLNQSERPTSETLDGKVTFEFSAMTKQPGKSSRRRK